MKKLSIAIMIAAAFGLFGGTAAHAQGDTVKTMRTEKDGTLVINTSGLAVDVMGFQAQTPVEIYIDDGKVSEIKPMPNSETPKFFDRAATILGSWKGLTVAKALGKKVDAVSGATYSSNALIENVRIGLKYALDEKK